MAERDTSNTPSTSKGFRTWKDKFQQQELEAWQPIFTAEKVWGVFLGIGLVFIAAGIPILMALQSVVEHKINYTDCVSKDGSGQTCKDYISKFNMSDIFNHPKCTCLVNFTIPQDMTGPIYMYYGLENFYQNHRRYVVSRDDRQLAGKGNNEADSDCNPYDMEGGKKIAPCGSIANSMFNDILKLNKAGAEVTLNKAGIAWESDKNRKFANPDPENWNETVKPPFWEKPIQDIEGQYTNEAFIVWMRTAAFPNFRKLYAKLDLPEDDKLEAGTELNLEITYTYRVDQFDGKKYMILSNTSFFGGKNNFLGIAYITVGCICVLLGIMFFIIHQKFTRGQNFQNSQS